MQTACQIIVLLLIVIGFLAGLYQDFHGRCERKPYGFQGALVSIVLTLLLLIVNWKAGAFSTLLP